jgi:drug/metabolite transporter (DMT)-like permease
MPVSALMLALAAAFLHALWNLLVARAEDIRATTAVALGVGVVAFAPVAAFAGRVEAGAVPWIAASAALELLYFLLLTHAYGTAELSLVYPIARGTAPLVVLAGSAAAGHRPSALETAGVAAVAAGILLVRGLRRGSVRGFAFALAIGVVIAAYTLVDNQGIEHASPLPYLELVLAPVALVAALGIRRPRLRAALRPVAIAAGLSSFGAYALVLAALQLSAAAPVAAVRETGVVIAVALAVVFLRERVSAARAAGAALVVSGVALLSL